MLRLPKRQDRELDVQPQSAGRARTTTVDSLLGMLALEPMSGYELRAMIARSTANFWQESFGQIYPALRKLVTAGLADVEEQRTDGERFKKTYKLTHAGQARLKEWLAMPCERQTIRDELLLKLFFGIKASPETLLAHVRQRRGEYEADLQRYRALEIQLPEAQHGNPGLPYFRITLRNGLLDAEAQIRWCDETIETLEEISCESDAQLHRAEV